MDTSKNLYEIVPVAIISSFFPLFHVLTSHLIFAQGKVFYTSLTSKPSRSSSIHYFSTDTELVYWNFYLDFGPLNLGHLMRFCLMLNAKLEDPKLHDKTIVYYSGSHGQRKANSIFLICGWSILFLNKTPEEAYTPFRNITPPLPNWHDATPTTCHFVLTVFDTLCGLYKAHKLKYFDLEHFDLAEYEHYEQVSLFPPPPCDPHPSPLVRWRMAISTGA
jgi:cell division cycle 14